MYDARKCHCGEVLTFDDASAEGHAPVVCAYCPRCRARAASGFEDDGHVVVCTGYGRTEDAAALDYHERVNTF